MRKQSLAIYSLGVEEELMEEPLPPERGIEVAYSDLCVFVASAVRESDVPVCDVDVPAPTSPNILSSASERDTVDPELEIDPSVSGILLSLAFLQESREARMLALGGFDPEEGGFDAEEGGFDLVSSIQRQ
jgi:hypothetical protein